MVWKPDTQLQNGKYIVEKTLGEGGFGITYLAKEDSGKSVAIKTLNDDIRKRRDFSQCQEDFLNEALRLAQCRHPHVVRVYQIIQHDSLWCIVMDYIDGTNLGRLLEQEGVLPEIQGLRYIRQIGEALRVVHHQGFLHRDVKPLNILLKRDRTEAVLIDFGMAREFTPNLTQVHTEYVSRGFAPIEQYDRRSLRGAYTDVYGLAATLYALMTAEVPESATARDRQIAKGKPDPLIPPQQLNAQISDRTVAAILQGMALEPEHRPQTVDEWLSLFDAPTEPIAVCAPPTFSEPAPQWSSAVGIDYTRLHDLLESHQWQEADRQTDAIILQVCDRFGQGKLGIEDIREFPCRDLRTIDRLWVKYSGGHFGFSVQRRLWEEVDRNYEAFGDRLGWRRQTVWQPYAELTFGISAPPGHLPSWGRRGRLWSFFGSRIGQCSL
ncbi:MAG: serine/threonine-protein kinase [Geitlerinemataceae cyanobacterium]